MRRFPPSLRCSLRLLSKGFPSDPGECTAITSPALIQNASMNAYGWSEWFNHWGCSRACVLPVFPALATCPLLWTILLSDWLCSFYSNGAGSALFANSTFPFFLALENFVCGDICCLLWFLLTDCETKTGFWKRLKVFFLQSSAYNLQMKNIKCFIDFQRDAWRLMMTNEHLLPWWKHLFYKWCSIYWWCCSSQWVNLRLSS